METITRTIQVVGQNWDTPFPCHGPRKSWDDIYVQVLISDHRFHRDRDIPICSGMNSFTK